MIKHIKVSNKILSYPLSASLLPLFSSHRWLPAPFMLHCQLIMLLQLTTPLQLILLMLQSIKSSFQSPLLTRNTLSTMELRTPIPETSSHKANHATEMSSRDNTLWSNLTVQSELLTTLPMTTMASTQSSTRPLQSSITLQSSRLTLQLQSTLTTPQLPTIIKLLTTNTPSKHPPKRYQYLIS
jgi:hypothetical protein